MVLQTHKTGGLSRIMISEITILKKLVLSFLYYHKALVINDLVKSHYFYHYYINQTKSSFCLSTKDRYHRTLCQQYWYGTPNYSRHALSSPHSDPHITSDLSLSHNCLQDQVVVNPHCSGFYFCCFKGGYSWLDKK